MTPCHPETPIEIAGARLTRGDRAVLDGIGLNITERRVALVGRNGSGKSTLIRAIAGLAPVDSGSVSIAGTDPARDRAAALKLVGVLFQNPDHQIIFPTVGEEVAFGLRQQGCDAPRDLALEWLKRFGRSHWLDRSVVELSQGQRHLVCLIAVLAMQPRLILLDEPMAGLDLPTVRALQDMLEALPQSILHATHDLTLIDRYDRVIWLEQGRVAGDGPPADVLPAYVATMSEAGDAFADFPA